MWRYVANWGEAGTGEVVVGSFVGSLLGVRRRPLRPFLPIGTGLLVLNDFPPRGGQ